MLLLGVVGRGRWEENVAAQRHHSSTIGFLDVDHFDFLLLRMAAAPKEVSILAGWFIVAFQCELSSITQWFFWTKLKLRLRNFQKVVFVLRKLLTRFKQLFLNVSE